MSAPRSQECLARIAQARELLEEAKTWADSENTEGKHLLLTLSAVELTRSISSCTASEAIIRKVFDQ